MFREGKFSLPPRLPQNSELEVPVGRKGRRFQVGRCWIRTVCSRAVHPIVTYLDTTRTVVMFGRQPAPTGDGGEVAYLELGWRSRKV